MDPAPIPDIDPPLKILVVEDDEDVGRAIVNSLERSGMHTAWAMTGADAIALKRNFVPNVILLDLTLPDVDGIEMVKLLTRERDCGIIIVSGLSSEADRIVGLELGADDYVAKPPRMNELRARIRAVHRRVRQRMVTRTDPAQSVVRLGKITVDLLTRKVLSTGGRIELTAAEFSALNMLLAVEGETVSRDRLCEVALHRPWRAEDRSVDQLIFTLRQKLSHGDQQQMIHSIRGAGYMLAVSKPPPEPAEPSVPVEES